MYAENGEGGSGNNKTGRYGKDMIIEVPLGPLPLMKKPENRKWRYWKMARK